MTTSRKDTKVKAGKKDNVAATSSTTRGRESKEQVAVRQKDARKLKRLTLNTQDRRDIFERWRANPSLRDKMRKLKPRERKPVPNMKSYMHEMGYNSSKSFLREYNHYVKTGDASPSACAGGNTPLISPEFLKKAVKDAASATTTVGGMSYKKFLSFIDPYVRNTRRQYRKAGAYDVQFPLSEFATDKTLKWYYRRVLPWEVRRGDRAIQALLNVRNDLLAWISHHCVIVAVVAGCDGKTWPHSVDKLVPRSYSCMNIDAFSVKVEGGEFGGKVRGQNFI